MLPIPCKVYKKLKKNGKLKMIKNKLWYRMNLKIRTNKKKKNQFNLPQNQQNKLKNLQNKLKSQPNKHKNLLNRKNKMIKNKQVKNDLNSII